MKNICFTILFSFALCGCLKNKDFQDGFLKDFQNVSCSKNPQQDILGKWQLIGVTSVWFSPIEHSQDNIIYEFKDNNIVVIFHDSNEIEPYPLPGEYSYNFGIPGQDGNGIVVAGENFYSYCVSEKLMVLSSVSVDGLGLYFKRMHILSH